MTLLENEARADSDCDCDCAVLARGFSRTRCVLSVFYPTVEVVVGHRRGGAIGGRLVLGTAGAVRGWRRGRRWLSSGQQSEPRHNPGDGPPSPPRGAFPRGQHRTLQEHQDLARQGG